MIAEYYITAPPTFWPQIFVTYTNDLTCSNTEDEDLKARRRRFQEFTASLRPAAVKPCAIRPAGKKWTGKPGARAREQRDRRKTP